MNDEPKRLDSVESCWQPVAVVSLEVEPKRKPARPLKNAAWDIASNIVIIGAIVGRTSFLIPPRRWTTVLWQASIGGIFGLLIGIRDWLRRPARINCG